MKNEFFLDHLVVTVADLSEAVLDFEELGFQITLGGRNGPVHNGLIIFDDGTYIELISPIKKPLRRLLRLFKIIGLLALMEWLKPSIKHRFYYWLAANEGLCDWCVRCADINQAISYFETHNIAMTPPEHYQRLAGNGEKADWYLAAPQDRRLPFILQDSSPRSIRVPMNSTEHKNGAVGIEMIINHDVSARASTQQNRQRQKSEKAISHDQFLSVIGDNRRLKKHNNEFVTFDNMPRELQPKALNNSLFLIKLKKKSDANRQQGLNKKCRLRSSLTHGANIYL